MKVKLYVEGGGDTNQLKRIVAGKGLESFLLKKLPLKQRMPKDNRVRW